MELYRHSHIYLYGLHRDNITFTVIKNKIIYNAIYFQVNYILFKIISLSTAFHSLCILKTINVKFFQ